MTNKNKGEEVTVFVSFDRTIRFSGKITMSRDMYETISEHLENEEEHIAHDLIDDYCDIDNYDFDDIDYVDDFELVEE